MGIAGGRVAPNNAVRAGGGRSRAKEDADEIMRVDHGKVIRQGRRSCTRCAVCTGDERQASDRTKSRVTPNEPLSRARPTIQIVSCSRSKITTTTNDTQMATGRD
jgi:hypothetical protein